MRDTDLTLRGRRIVGSFSFLVMAASLVTTGCGDGKLQTYPVTGTVLVDNKPADGAMVIFCPTEGSEEVQKQRPFGYTSPEGKYELTTFEKGDGLPAGNYKVLIQWPSKQGADARDGGGLGPDRLRGRYMNLEKSTLTVKVEGPLDVPPFELKSQ